MAGGLNDLELEETLDEIPLSPPARGRATESDAPPQRAHRIGARAVVGIALVLALITWVSLQVDAPPKARPVDLLSTDAPALEIAPLDAPEIASALHDVRGRPHAHHRHGEAEHCYGDGGCHAHHEHGGAQHAHNHTSRPLNLPPADVAPVSEPAATALPTEPIPVTPPLDLELVPPAPLDATAPEALPTEPPADIQIIADTAASALAEATALLRAAQEMVARAAEEPLDIRSVSDCCPMASTRVAPGGHTHPGGD